MRQKGKSAQLVDVDPIGIDGILRHLKNEIQVYVSRVRCVQRRGRHLSHVLRSGFHSNRPHKHDNHLEVNSPVSSLAHIHVNRQNSDTLRFST
jgi:hypothetical protein